MKQNIICVSNTAWDTNFLQSTKQLVSHIALENRMLYIDYPYTVKDVLKSAFKNSPIDFKRQMGIRSRIRTDITEHNSQVYVLTLPPVLPVNWITNTRIYAFVTALNNLIINSCILKYQKKLGFDNPVVINAWNPVSGMSMIGKLKERLLVYYCYDEISAGKWVKKHGKHYEDLFLKKVSKVIVTSKELQNTKSKLNAACYLVRNGVDFPLYQKFHQQFKEDVKNRYPDYKKIVGYVGTIDDRLDQDLLTYSMEKMTETLFVYIGRVTHKEVRENLSKAKNSHFIDAMDPGELPEHIGYFSVGIIPFVKNKFTVSIYPMKINEYMAMGKPVALTNFANLEEFKDLCSFADDKDEFVQALNNEIRSDSKEKSDKRIEVARQNSWQNRAKEFMSILNN